MRELQELANSHTLLTKFTWKMKILSFLTLTHTSTSNYSIPSFEIQILYWTCSQWKIMLYAKIVKHIFKFLIEIHILRSHRKDGRVSLDFIGIWILKFCNLTMNTVSLFSAFNEIAFNLFEFQTLTHTLFFWNPFFHLRFG